MRFNAVLFDFDDTLTVPGGLDYAAIRRDMGCPADSSILGYLEELENEEDRREASDILDRYEMAAAAGAAPADGAEDLLIWVREAGLKQGILTRNSRPAVLRSLQNFSRTLPGDFDVIISRDDGIPVKPEPDGVYYAAKVFGVRPGEMLVVGDYIYDIQAGNAAGAASVFLASRTDRKIVPPPCRYRIERISQVKDILEGKLAASHVAEPPENS